MADDNYPSVDEGTFVLRWRGRECHLGNTNQFWLAQRLIEADGRNVDHLSLAEALGDGLMSSVAIRKTVQRLRAALRRSPLKELADAIITKNKSHVRLDVSGLRQWVQHGIEEVPWVAPSAHLPPADCGE